MPLRAEDENPMVGYLPGKFYPNRGTPSLVRLTLGEFLRGPSESLAHGVIYGARSSLRMTKSDHTLPRWLAVVTVILLTIILTPPVVTAGVLVSASGPPQLCSLPAETLLTGRTAAGDAVGIKIGDIVWMAGRETRRIRLKDWRLLRVTTLDDQLLECRGTSGKTTISAGSVRFYYPGDVDVGVQQLSLIESGGGLEATERIGGTGGLTIDLLPEHWDPVSNIELSQPVYPAAVSPADVFKIRLTATLGAQEAAILAQERKQPSWPLYGAAFFFRFRSERPNSRFSGGSSKVSGALDVAIPPDYVSGTLTRSVELNFGTPFRTSGLDFRGKGEIFVFIERQSLQDMVPNVTIFRTASNVLRLPLALAPAPGEKK